jgi:hypothetical protein
MNGILKPNQSSSSRLTLPLRPKCSCIATAPTKGGMISGRNPSVWTSAAPRNAKRVVITASGRASADAQTTDIADT